MARVQALFSTLLCRRDILIQPEEIVRIVLGLYGSQSFPPISICLGNTIAFVPAHEVHIDSRDHRRSQAVEQIPSPVDIVGILARCDPVAQDIDDERRTSITKCGFIRRYAGRGSSEKR